MRRHDISPELQVGKGKLANEQLEMSTHISRYKSMDNSVIGHGNRWCVTLKRVVNGDIEYRLANRFYESIVRLKDGVESALPEVDGCRWLMNKSKGVSFVLAYIFSGCDFSPAIQSLSLLEIWVLFLEAPRTKGILQRAIVIRSEEGVKLVATCYTVNTRRYEGKDRRTPADPCIGI